MKYTPVLDDLIGFDGFDIGLDDYPIWGASQSAQELNRESLNNKIIDFYRFRQIGQETADRFVWAINEAMYRIMPSYIEMYNKTRESAIGKITKITNEIDERVKHFTNGSQTNTLTGTDAQSNTPQNTMNLSLTNFSGYATSIGKSNTESVSGQRTDDTVDEASTDHSKTEEILGWADIQDKKIIMDIERMIVEDEALNECFMLIY